MAQRTILVVIIISRSITESSQKVGMVSKIDKPPQKTPSSHFIAALCHALGIYYVPFPQEVSIECSCQW